MGNRVTLAIGSRTCPTCGCTYERLSRHWTSGSCPRPELARHQHDLVTGLLLGNAAISGNSANKHLVLVTTNRPFAAWAFEELGWLAHGLVRIDPVNAGETTDWDVTHHYRVRTMAHPELAPYREWYVAPGEKRIPLGLGLTPRSARAWYACSGGLQWHGEYDSQRSAVFSALHDKRANRIGGLLERAEFEPTRAGKRVQLPPRETRAFLDWIGDPVPGVGYKWATERTAYDDFRREQRAERWWLALHPERETHIEADKMRMDGGQSD